jgi:hypothetical protein
MRLHGIVPVAAAVLVLRAAPAFPASPPAANAAKPAGEWNELEIVCRGPRIRVTLNGRIVQDVNQTDNGAIRERKRTGYLMLQNHGHASSSANSA